MIYYLNLKGKRTEKDVLDLPASSAEDADLGELAPALAGPAAGVVADIVAWAVGVDHALRQDRAQIDLRKDIQDRLDNVAQIELHNKLDILAEHAQLDNKRRQCALGQIHHRKVLERNAAQTNHIEDVLQCREPNAAEHTIDRREIKRQNLGHIGDKPIENLANRNVEPKREIGNRHGRTQNLHRALHRPGGQLALCNTEEDNVCAHKEARAVCNTLDRARARRKLEPCSANVEQVGHLGNVHLVLAWHKAVPEAENIGQIQILHAGLKIHRAQIHRELGAKLDKNLVHVHLGRQRKRRDRRTGIDGHLDRNIAKCKATQPKCILPHANHAAANRHSKRGERPRDRKVQNVGIAINVHRKLRADAHLGIRRQRNHRNLESVEVDIIRDREPRGLEADAQLVELRRVKHGQTGAKAECEILEPRAKNRHNLVAKRPIQRRGRIQIEPADHPEAIRHSQRIAH
eukprot:comp22475_c0_seq1/m.55583 comp22475_c0_seq1/g.55583  ORF comp22475_c0_seq1/g.55583 comp22475_c0_seq1/m.55583 type:complete len:461 (+) comp22475_c0_seq1:10-1392(+)